MANTIEKLMENTVKLNIMVENPTLDLEDYANAYNHMWKYYRLLFVADGSPTYRMEALKIAINDVKKTSNVGMYKYLFKKLNDCKKQNGQLTDTQLPEYDSNWVQLITTKSEQLSIELKADLRKKKVSSIRANIKRIYEELGEHYLNCGDILIALNEFLGARDYCTNRTELVQLNMKIVKCKIFFHEWTSVLKYIEDLKNIQSDLQNSSTLLNTQLKCFTGLAQMQLKNYKSAVLSFVACNFNYADKLEMVSAENVATYVIICGLAVLDRNELINEVLKSSSFKSFLELVPHLVDLADKFTKGKYFFCLTTLNKMRNHLMLDLYLSAHLDVLYADIRKRALIQYFLPYNNADMVKMATEFDVTYMELEHELEKLIESGQLQARIDSCGKKLVRYVPNLRQLKLQRVLDAAIELERRNKILIVRQAMARVNL